MSSREERRQSGRGRPGGGAGNRHPEVPGVRMVPASELLGFRGLLHIVHEGEVYTLRLTRNGKLILTK